MAENGKSGLGASPRGLWLRFRKRFIDQMPNKRFINLAAENTRRINWVLAVPAMLLVIAAAAVFAKLAVLDRMEVAERERRQLAELQSAWQESMRQLEDYAAVQEQYAHYTFSGMTEEELHRADRVEVMRMLRRTAYPRAEVTGWSLSGNDLTLTVRCPTLQDVNILVQRLSEELMVEYCAVSTAATERQQREQEAPQGVDAVVTMTVKNLKPREVRS